MSDIAEIEAHLVRAQAAYDKMPLSGPVTSWCEMYGEDLLDSCTKLLAALKQRTELIDAAAGHWLESCRTTSPPIPWEGAIDGAMEAVCKEVERLRARVAELEKERDGALADACSARIYASDATVHLRVRVAELEAMVAEAAEIRRKWGIESDESLTECVERNIEGWKQRALKAEQRVAELETQRDAAFKMSKCECGPEECCANLVALHKRVAELEAAQEWRPLYDEAKDEWLVPADVDVLLFMPSTHSQLPAEIKAGFARSTKGGWFAGWATHWMPLPAQPKVAT